MARKSKGDFKKASDAPTRTGLSAERITKSIAGGVDPSVVALQSTLSSASGRKYTAYDMLLIYDFYKDNEVRVTMTKKTAKILIKNQQSLEVEFDEIHEVTPD